MVFTARPSDVPGPSGYAHAAQERQRGRCCGRTADEETVCRHGPCALTTYTRQRGAIFQMRKRIGVRLTPRKYTGENLFDHFGAA